MSTESDRFAVFILTHGRAKKVETYKTLKRQGYTGDIYLIVDNEDGDLDEYRARYGDKVIVFDKLAVAQRIDEGDNFNDRRAVIYARNASFEIAQQLGVRYFLELDDDYKQVDHKFSADLAYKERPVRDLDRLFASMVEYFKTIPALTIALAQNGDFIGGRESSAAEKLLLKRKAMNTFFCDTQRPFEFFGRVNEDVNTYVTLGNRGNLFLTVMNAAILQQQTQQNSGGMAEMYLDEGTYWKSFYSVMYAPSCVTVGEIGYRYRRIHHRVSWANAVPCILSEEHRRVQGRPSPSTSVLSGVT
jgi:hypothetical protein